jgi:hypothetical protein
VTRLAEPAISLVVDWVPVSPDEWEAEYDGTTLRVYDHAILGDWRWSCFRDGQTAFGFKGSRADAMLACLAWAGHPAAREAVGLA